VSVTNNIQMAFIITKNYGVDLPAETYRLAASPQITIPDFLSKPHHGSTQSAPRFREGWCWEILSNGPTSLPTSWGLRLARWWSGEGGVVRRRDYPLPCRWPENLTPWDDATLEKIIHQERALLDFPTEEETNQTPGGKRSMLTVETNPWHSQHQPNARFLAAG
jgi:hypothetical protein